MTTYLSKMLLYSSTRFLYSCMPKYPRYFQTNPTLFIKMFMEQENKYAYNIMESNGYVINISPPKDHNVIKQERDINSFLQEKWTSKTPSELCATFLTLSRFCYTHHICISNKIFDDFVDNLTDNIKHLTDEELIGVFYSLNTWPETESIRTRNYIEMWAALDDECLKRMKSWSIDRMLSFVSLMYMLNVTRVSDFSLKCLQHLTNKSKQLSPHQLVQTLFFIGILRKPTIDMHNLEVYLENNILEFTIDELAVMAMGFFKSKTPIRNMILVTKIIERIIENTEEIHEISLAALLKVIRYSMKFSNDDSIYRLLSALELQLNRFSVMCCVHIALLGTATLTVSKPCLNKIAENVLCNITKARLKDLERLTFTFGIFNFIPQTQVPFFEAMLDELRRSERKEEIHKYGRSFANCLAFLSMVGIYPTDLINQTLDPKFLEVAYGKAIYGYGREILTLHNICEIYYKDIILNRLAPKTVSVLAKKYTDYIPDEINYKRQFNITEKMMLEVMQVLKKIRGGHDYVKGDHILTHYQRGDIIMCNDSNGRPIKVNSILNLETKTFGPIVRPPDNNNWIVLIIAGRNAIIRDINLATGPFHSKYNELKILGYYPAIVLWSVWSKLSSIEEKTTYLDELIIKALHS